MAREPAGARRAAGVLAAVVLLLPVAVADAAPPPARHTLRLINRTRSAHDVARLHSDSRLARAARGHSRDMVAHRYFAHRSPAGATPTDRIARTGWMHERAVWTIGEDLAWHVGPLSPRAIIKAWLRSPPHRHVLLDPRFRHIGIGIAPATPSGGDGGTFTADFGT
jgi:uncharacterized protein YkwD